MHRPKKLIPSDLGDGVIRHLFFNVAATQALAEQYGENFMNRPVSVVMPQLIMAGLVEKEGVTAEEIIEYTPAADINRLWRTCLAAMAGMTLEELEAAEAAAKAKADAEAAKNGESRL